MESSHRSGDGASGGGGGGLCTACGYQYPNPHPSAKQRRAHRKNCGKPPSAAAAGVEEGKKLLLGEGEGGGGGPGGEGNGARAAVCGGGLPGSARVAGDVVENEDNAEHSSPNGTRVQDIINKLSEDCLTSCVHDVASEIAPKAIGIDNDEIRTEVAENAPHLADGHPSQPVVSSDLCQDASTSVLRPEPEDGARFTSDFSVDETNNSDVTSLASNATAGEVSAQTNAVVVCPDDIAVTEVDGMINTIGKDKNSEDILVKGSGIDSSCQEKSQTKIDDGHSATTVEEDPSVNNFNVVSKEEFPGEETEPKEQSRLILSNSIEQVSTVKEPVNLLGNKETCTEKHVCADDTNGDDLFELATGDCHLEAPDSVKTHQQTDSISVAVDQLTIPEQTDIEEGQHCPDADGVGNQAVSSAIGPAVGAEVICAGSAANLTKNVCSSEVTTGDARPENVTHASGITFMPSQVDLAELDTYPTSHEIDMVSSRDGVEENRQNENTSAELTSHETNEVCIIDVEEKQQIEDITAYTTSHEADAVCSTGNFGENKQNEEVIAEASSHKISIVQSSVEEKEQIKEVIANPASNKIDVISSRDFVEEKKQSEVYVGTTQDVSVACSVENVEGKKQNEEIVADPTCEIDTVNIPSNVELKKHNEETTRDPTACEINMANITDNVKEKKQNEESTTDPTHAINVICSPGNEDNKLNKDMTEGPSYHEIIVVHGADNIKEKNEGTMSDPTSYKIDVVSTTDGVEERKQNEEITADPTSHGINVLHTIDNVEEKNEAATSEPTPCKIDAESNTDDVEEKRQNEEIGVDSGSRINNILQTTDNAEEKKQDKEVAADPASDKIAAAQSTDDAEERKQKEETAAKEINATQSTDDLKGDGQNEEVADKEVIVDSDKKHVSLKILLAEKGVETKAKKASTKDRVLSFRRRASKDNASPVKPGSPKAGSGHQDWNSPARLPIEKKPKGKKQQWVPFICCSSTN